MRILLVGEYSGFHNSLKHGLVQLGHKVTIIGDGDGFKKFPVDIDISTDYFTSSWLRQKVRVGWYKLTGNDLQDRLKLARFRESGILNNHYDIVQFINSNSFNCRPNIEKEMMSSLLEKADKAFLVACGDDYHYAHYLTSSHKGYSIINPEPDKSELRQEFPYTMKYLQDDYKQNYLWLLNQCEAIIPSHTDFKMALHNEPKATDIIPSAVQIDKFELNQNQDFETIEIFMGINRHNYLKKGIPYFEKALEIIKEKHNSKVNITIAEDLPYEQYMKSYNDAHIFLDQVLSYDQGYNALEAMAQGKVVFAGAGKEFLEAYGLSQAPLVDAQPVVDDLVKQLSYLIDNPDKIIELGKIARQFILEHHKSIKIAQQYQMIYNT